MLSLFSKIAPVYSRNVLFAATLTFVFSASLYSQENVPVVVQPGAPGQQTKTLPADIRPVLPARSVKDIEFMQGMIMHHAQAVEMTALIDSRTKNEELRLLGARISQSQSDEMNFMKRWLTLRGESTEMTHKMSDSHKHAGMNMPGMNMSGMDMSDKPMMPGMLSKKQMDALANAKGNEFDKLFLSGMIQHHKGALVMVKELFDTGSGQESQVFGFATDVDSGQRAEIDIMERLLKKLN